MLYGHVLCSLMDVELREMIVSSPDPFLYAHA